MAKAGRIDGGEEYQKAPKAGIGVSQICLIPTDIIKEIFFRLPIKSVMRFKSVCRELHNLLSDSDFAINYRKKWPFATLLLSGFRHRRDSGFPILSLLQISENYDCILTRLMTPKLSGFFIRGMCDGLLCLAVRKPWNETVYIYNPIMGDCIELPGHETKLKDQYFLTYGFGFCQFINKYKVFRISYNVSCHKSLEGPGEVLTVGVDDRWRSLADPKIPLSCGVCTVVSLNGAVHWLALDYESTWISTFDLGEERLSQTSHPRELKLNISRMILTSLDNQLCLIDSISDSVTILWRMKEHAFGNSWTPDVILGGSFPHDVCLRWLVPLTTLRSGEIVFSHRHDFGVFLYNPKTRKCVKIGDSKDSDCERNGYTPCLLPLKDVISGASSLSSSSNSIFPTFEL